MFCRHLFRLVRVLLQVGGASVAADGGVLQGVDRVARPRQADEFGGIVGLDDVIGKISSLKGLDKWEFSN